MLTPPTQYNKLSIIMTSKPMQTSKDNQNLDMPALTIDGLIEAQVAFMQQWLRTQAEPLSMEAWQWFAAHRPGSVRSARGAAGWVPDRAERDP